MKAVSTGIDWLVAFSDGEARTDCPIRTQDVLQFLMGCMSVMRSSQGEATNAEVLEGGYSSMNGESAKKHLKDGGCGSCVHNSIKALTLVYGVEHTDEEFSEMTRLIAIIDTDYATLARNGHVYRCPDPHCHQEARRLARQKVQALG
jgi:hypothetical protein